MCYLKGLTHGLIKSWKCRQLVLGTTIALRSIEAAFDPTSTPSSSSLHACILKCFATLYMWLHQCKQKTGVYQLWHKRGQHVLGTIKDGYWFLVSTHGCLCALSLDNRHIQWQVWRTRWNELISDVNTFAGSFVCFAWILLFREPPRWWIWKWNESGEFSQDKVLQRFKSCIAFHCNVGMFR